MESEGDGVVELDMVTLSKHVEEYEEYMKQGEELNVNTGESNQVNEECSFLEDVEEVSCKKTLHHAKLHPCPLNTLIGDPSNGKSETNEITISKNKPFYINSSFLSRKEEELMLTLEKHTK